MESESFIYTISSDDRTNTDADQIYYDIDFGGLNSKYNNFRIEVVNCILSGDVDNTIGYLILACDNLHSNGVFCRESLNSNQCVVAIIPTNADVLMSNGGVSFLADNIRSIRPVTFRLLNPDFTAVTDGVDINVSAETKWLLTLRLIPVEE